MRRKIGSESLEQQAVIAFCNYQKWRLPDCDRISKKNW